MTIDWLQSELFWFLLAVGCFLMEPILPYLYGAPFGAAALLTSALVWLLPEGAPWIIFLLFFAGLSVFFFLTLRPLLAYLLYGAKAKTNVGAIVGRKATLENVEARGRLINAKIRIDGVVWNAAPQNAGEEIKNGAKVIVTGIKGNTLFVKDIEKIAPEEPMPKGFAKIVYIIKKGGNHWIRS